MGRNGDIWKHRDRRLKKGVMGNESNESWRGADETLRCEIRREERLDLHYLVLIPDRRYGVLLAVFFIDCVLLCFCEASHELAIGEARRGEARP
jgi:hypothetical protein